MKKEWKLRKTGEGSLLDALLQSRGLTEPELKKSFLNPDYQRHIHDPLLLKDMDRAVARILEAIKNNERVTIFADYDADGVPAGAILALFFKKIGFLNFDVYIPDRHEEAYGLSLEAIKKLADQKTKLIVTVDCGIANEAEIAYAKKLGVEVVVTDHHLVPEEGIPKSAVAVVDPKREDDEYPCKHLCGAGVAFKLVQALIAQASNDGSFSNGLGIVSEDLRKVPIVVARGWEKWLLDLVAIATVSDMVPLVGENRTLVRYGLFVLRKSPRPGIQALCRVLNLKQEFLVEDDIAFLIGPRINAASRMGHGRQAYDLLTAETIGDALVLAEQLEKQNKARKSSVENILTKIESQCADELPPVLVIGDSSWSLGVLGLAAARVVEKYKRPVFLWSKNGSGLVKGSCRSDGSVNVVELMREAGEDFFANLGGHQYAGGFSLAEEKLGDLQARLWAAHEKVAKVEILEELLLDAELVIDDVHEATYALIDQLAPFGIDNPKPVFWFRELPIAQLKLMRGDLHLELNFKSKHGIISAMSFFNSYPDLKLRAGDRVDLAASIEKSYFRRHPELRLRVIDLHKKVV